MRVTGYVSDEYNEPLPGASVTVVDGDGKFLNVGTAADSSGYFEIDSPVVAGNFLKFTHVDRQTVIKPIPSAGLPVLVALQPKPDTLDEVVVTPGNNRSNGLLWLIAAVVVLKSL